MNDLHFERVVADAETTCARWLRAAAPLRALHSQILRHFAETGRPPAPGDLPGWSADTLAQLVDVDLVEADPATGRILGAYPFVAEPRGHRVHIVDGSTVESYCAIDALGIPAMLDRDATIASRDPHTGEPIHIDVRGGGATWEPVDAVASVPLQALCERDGRKAVDCVCPTTSFYASDANADAYRAEHGLSIEILTVPQARRLGTMAFGPLLTPDA